MAASPGAIRVDLSAPHVGPPDVRVAVGLLVEEAVERLSHGSVGHHGIEPTNELDPGKCAHGGGHGVVGDAIVVAEHLDPVAEVPGDGVGVDEVVGVRSGPDVGLHADPVAGIAAFADAVAGEPVVLDPVGTDEAAHVAQAGDPAAEAVTHEVADDLVARDRLAEPGALESHERIDDDAVGEFRVGDPVGPDEVVV